jgi:TonB family protein
MDEKNIRSRAIIGTIVVHVVVIVALIFLALRTPLPLPGEEGVEVSLGNSETGSGLVQPEEIVPVQESEPIVSKPEPQKIITQDVEEAPAIEEKKPEKKPEKEVVKEEPKVVKEEPKVNPRALYSPDSKAKTDAGSQGNGTDQADQGKETGSKTSTNPDGNSASGNGISFDLSGRGSVSLPKPAYESPEQGKVVVKIWVNRDGMVTRAQAGVKGTTITDQNLQNVARDAALKAVFTPDPKAAEIQTGTITYNFIRMN